MKYLSDLLRSLKPGKYWFYGFSHSIANDSFYFHQFYSALNAIVDFNESSVSGFTFSSGRELVSSGFFYFTYNPSGETELNWALSGDTAERIEERVRIKLSHHKINWENLHNKDNQILIEGDLDKPVAELRIPTGKTECTEDCMFFDACDRVRGSILNPSRLMDGISCETNNFSKQGIILEWK